MAKTYYDSVYTGPQMDAAFQIATVIIGAAVPENAGKHLAIGEDGGLTVADPPAAYDDTALADRVTALETTVSGLLDATGVSF